MVTSWLLGEWRKLPYKDPESYDGFTEFTPIPAFARTIPICEGGEGTEPEDGVESVDSGESVGVCVLAGVGEAGGHSFVDYGGDGEEALSISSAIEKEERRSKERMGVEGAYESKIPSSSPINTGTTPEHSDCDTPRHEYKHRLRNM